MKTKLICFGLILAGGLVGCVNHSRNVEPSEPVRVQNRVREDRRVSIAKVGEVQLEVRQPSNSRNEIEIKINDFAAAAHEKKEVACDLYWIDEQGIVARQKFLSITLQRTFTGSSEYFGRASNRQEFEHGNKFEIVYRSDSLPLPISTWYACYYH